MTGLLVLGLVPLLAAVMFWLRAVRERDARLDAERRLEAAGSRDAEVEEARLRFMAVVAHELRSPLSAIIGYQELLADGIYGEVDEQAGEALQRIGHAARQLLTLTDGMEELAGRTSASSGGTVGVDVIPALRESLLEAERHAASRSVRLDTQVPADLSPVRGDPERARTALDLTLQAAVKLARAGQIAVAVAQNGGVTRFTLKGDGLELCRLPADDFSSGEIGSQISSGPALRLAIARRIATRMQGGLELHGDTWTMTFSMAESRQ